jgi:hypothetical protein
MDETSQTGVSQVVDPSRDEYHVSDKHYYNADEEHY